MVGTQHSKSNQRGSRPRSEPKSVSARASCPPRMFARKAKLPYIPEGVKWASSPASWLGGWRRLLHKTGKTSFLLSLVDPEPVNYCNFYQQAKFSSWAKRFNSV